MNPRELGMRKGTPIIFFALSLAFAWHGFLLLHQEYGFPASAGRESAPTGLYGQSDSWFVALLAFDRIKAAPLEYTEEDWKQLIEVARIVQGTEPPFVQAAIEQYCPSDGSGDLDDYKRIWHLNRVVFSLPVDRSWPVAWTDGQPAFFPDFRPWRGPGQSPAEEYDFFCRRFPFRDLSGRTGLVIADLTRQFDRINPDMYRYTPDDWLALVDVARMVQALDLAFVDAAIAQYCPDDSQRRDDVRTDRDQRIRFLNRVVFNVPPERTWPIQWKLHRPSFPEEDGPYSVLVSRPLPEFRELRRSCQLRVLPDATTLDRELNGPLSTDDDWFFRELAGGCRFQVTR